MSAGKKYAMAMSSSDQHARIAGEEMIQEPDQFPITKTLPFYITSCFLVPSGGSPRRSSVSPLSYSPPPLSSPHARNTQNPRATRTHIQAPTSRYHTNPIPTPHES
ncbi:hypothetical protein DPSP01_003221 [Paraphaeosphaeria sporulosa]